MRIALLVLTLFLPTLALAQAPIQNPDILVAFKTLESAATEFGKTPFCVTSQPGAVPVCQPAFTKADVGYVKGEVSSTLTTMRTANPGDQMMIARNALMRIATHLGSGGYQRLWPYINAATLAIGLETPRKLGPDDQ